FYGGHLYFTAVSPYTSGGHSFGNYSTHYNLLSTVEWLLGLGGTGNNDSTSSFPPMKALFHVANNTTSDYRLSGTVTSSGTGQPISGATVAVSAGPSTTTSSAGAYNVTLPNGTYSVTASASGFTSQTQSVTVAGSGASQNFALTPNSVPPPKYPIRGVVEDGLNASPVAGATVNLVGGPSMPTGANGTFWFSEPNGSYTVSAWAPGYHRVSQTATIAGSGTSLTLPLSAFDWEVRGEVADSGTGQGIVGANVSAASGALSAPASAISNASGGYALQLPNGSFSVSVSAAGYLSGSATAVVHGAPLDLNLALTASGSVVRYAISGSVTYASNGSVAPGVPVEVDPTATAVTDPTGHFSVLVPNGTYTISSHEPGWRSASRSVTVSGGPVSVSLVLAENTYPVTGVVRGPGGTPSPGVSLAIMPSGTSTITASDGSYSLALPNGTYHLRVTGAGLEEQNDTVTVSGAPVVLNLNVTPSGSSGIPPKGPSAAPSPVGSWLLLTAVGGVGLGVAIFAGALGARRLRRRQP
ncbi:MAG TPA: carboxypeptidase regulatory-like domain-containing protein, partial [Thermoplasmata archaeon]|nr:carboxypeptidase regulatory-like domain-containing protein [Thermoplasmata archaeon]